MCRFPFDLSLFHLFGTRVSRVPLTCRSVHSGSMARSTLLDTELRYVADDRREVTTSVRDAVAAALSTAQPVRRVGSYAGQRHYSGLFWSATTGGHVPYESHLELDRLWLADFDPTVTWIAAQPMWLRGRDGTVIRRHAPDLLLTRADRSLEVVDVKPGDLARRPKVASVFDWTARVCETRGWRYQVWSGADPVRLANIRTLAIGRRPGHVDPDDLARLRAAGKVGVTLGAALGQGPRPAQIAAVMTLLWMGHWTVDLSVPLGLGAPITSIRESS